jgi:hypothetical protein
MNKIYSKVLIIILYSEIVCTEVFNTVKNNQMRISCTLNNNQPGHCIPINDCVYAQNLRNNGKFNIIQLCKLQGHSKFVCCPQPEDIQNPSPEYPKSKKFNDALCKDNSSPIAIALTMINKSNRVDIGEYPFYVSLGYPQSNNKIEYKCGGSLIADDVVVTSAHCVSNKSDFPTIVKLGKVTYYTIFGMK